MTTERKRVMVSIYEDELPQMRQKLGKEEVSHATIREFLGLKPNAKSVGDNTKIRDALKTATVEQKAELLRVLGITKITEKP